MAEMIPGLIPTRSDLVLHAPTGETVAAEIENLKIADGEKANKADLDAQNTYSTTETWTGEYWIDGRKIYRKTFVLNNVTGGAKTIAHGVSNIGSYRVFDFTSSYYIGSNSTFPAVTLMPDTSTRAQYESGLTNINFENIYFYKAARTDQGTVTAYITIRYTCTDR